MTGAPGPRPRSDWLLWPNQLTLTRFYAAALLPAALWGLEDRATAEAVALGLFVYASLTDFVDGYVARRFKLTSALGAQLDTLADKALLISALAALSATRFEDAPLFWAGAALIALREVGVTLLRRWRRGASGLTTTLAAKWKTTLQMAAVSTLLTVGPIGRALGDGAGQAVETVGLALFAAAVWLTVSTGLAYLRAALAADPG